MSLYTPLVIVEYSVKPIIRGKPSVRAGVSHVVHSCKTSPFPSIPRSPELTSYFHGYFLFSADWVPLSLTAVVVTCLTLHYRWGKLRGVPPAHWRTEMRCEKTKEKRED